MALSTVTVTTSYQQIASGTATITVVNQGTGNLLFNETASDTNALISNEMASSQFSQNEVKNTFVRGEGAGWVVRVDGTI